MPRPARSVHPGLRTAVPQGAGRERRRGPGRRRPVGARQDGAIPGEEHAADVAGIHRRARRPERHESRAPNAAPGARSDDGERSGRERRSAAAREPGRSERCSRSWSRRRWRALPAEDKLLLLLYYEQGLTLDEMAGVVGGSKAALSRKLQRTRDELRASIDSLSRRRAGPPPSRCGQASTWAVWSWTWAGCSGARGWNGNREELSKTRDGPNRTSRSRARTIPACWPRTSRAASTTRSAARFTAAPRAPAPTAVRPSPCWPARPGSVPVAAKRRTRGEPGLAGPGGDGRPRDRRGPAHGRTRRRGSTGRDAVQRRVGGSRQPTAPPPAIVEATSAACPPRRPIPCWTPGSS